MSLKIQQNNYLKSRVLWSRYTDLVKSIPRYFFVGLIILWQWTLSPDHGIVSLYTFGRCKFRPTCSEYTKEMIMRYGVFIGGKEGFKQIKKCH